MLVAVTYIVHKVVSRALPVCAAYLFQLQAHRICPEPNSMGFLS